MSRRDVANVYRRGAKDVHAARESLDPDEPWDIRSCSFDKGGKWSPEKPEGPECYRCFGALAVGERAPLQPASSRKRRPTRRHLAIGSGAGTAALIAALLSQGGPVNPVSVVASPGMSFYSVLPMGTPTYTWAPTPTPYQSLSVPTTGPVSPEPVPSPFRVIERVVERVIEKAAPTPCPKPGKGVGWCRR